MPRARCRILSGSRALARVVATRRPRRGRPAPCRRSRPAGPEASRRAPERPAGSRRARFGRRGRRQLRRWSTSRPAGPRHTSRNGTPPPTPGRPGGRRRHPADRVASTPAERPRRADATRMTGPRGVTADRQGRGTPSGRTPALGRQGRVHPGRAAATRRRRSDRPALERHSRPTGLRALAAERPAERRRRPDRSVGRGPRRTRVDRVAARRRYDGPRNRAHGPRPVVTTTSIARRAGVRDQV